MIKVQPDLMPMAIKLRIEVILSLQIKNATSMLKFTIVVQPVFQVKESYSTQIESGKSSVGFFVLTKLLFSE